MKKRLFALSGTNDFLRVLCTRITCTSCTSRLPRRVKVVSPVVVAVRENGRVLLLVHAWGTRRYDALSAVPSRATTE